MVGYAVTKNREIKAKKIESVLKDVLKKPIKDLNILDIGAGVGEISSYLSKNNNVIAADIENQLSPHATWGGGGRG